MLGLIHAELFRLGKSLTLKIMLMVTAVYSLIYGFSFLNYLYLKIGTIEETNFVPLSGFEAFASIDIDGMFAFFVPFLVVFFFTSEFSKKTFGNLIGAEISKSKLFIAKYISFGISILTIVFFSAVFITSAVTVVNGWGANFDFRQVSEIFGLCIRIILMQISTASLCVVLSLFIHNDAIIVILYFASSLVESIITSLISRIEIKSGVSEFLVSSLPSNCTDTFQSLSVTSTELWNGSFCVCISIILCLTLGVAFIRKIDINY